MVMVGVTYSGSDQQEPPTMEIRSILLGMSLSTMSPPFVAMGADLAQRFQADLNGFAAADVPVEPIVAEWTAALSQRYDEERRRVEEALENGEMVFTKGITGSSGHSWRSLITRPTPVLIDAANRQREQQGTSPTTKTPIQPPQKLNPAPRHASAGEGARNEEHY
jgi:hypothetical protein